MRRSTLFFGIIIVLLGVMLLAINLGVVTSKVWSYFWPMVLVIAGAWFIYGTYVKKSVPESVSRSIALENDTEAEIEFNYGAGILAVTASSDPRELVGGTFVGGLTEEVNRANGKAFLKLSMPHDMIFPGNWDAGHQGFGWNVGLTKDIPLKLRFHTGACEARLDLRDLKVTDLTVETGASKTVVQMPANAGFTRAELTSGAAEMNVEIPAGVAAKITESTGLSGINIDTARFLKDGHTYRSADYDTAVNKIDIKVEGGVGSVDIR